MPPPPKRAKATAKSVAATKKRRKAQAGEADGDGDLHFLASDDEQPQQRARGAADSDSEDEDETVDQKRLRLAKEYLQNLRGVPGDDEDGEDGDADDLLSKKLAKDADEAVGRLQRRIASRVVVPSQAPSDTEPSTSGSATAASTRLYGTGRFSRCHRLPPTAVALTTDDRRAYTVAKDGTIFSWDVESWSKTQLFRPGDQQGANADRRADWLPQQQRSGSMSALFAAAVSSDGLYLAVGGGDKRIHVFDTRTGQHIQEYPGHKDVVTGLAFREGTHTLMSGSYDRTVKIWSLDDRAYVDTLFGHHAAVLAVDVLRSERAVTAGQDRTCRVWKIPEESQLVYRPPTQSVDCLRYITASEWLSGTTDGSLQVWSQQKKKPVSVLKRAHGRGSPYGEGAVSAGHCDADCAGWVQSVSVCRGSDLAASGAGDGLVKLWRVEPHATLGGAHMLRSVGALPARGFVNGVQLARSGRFVLAALGQEPRLGRWGRDPMARNGLLLHTLELADES